MPEERKLPVISSALAVAEKEIAALEAWRTELCAAIFNHPDRYRLSDFADIGGTP